MTRNEESSNFSVEQGCPVHGDEHMRECSMCGAEFCRLCVPKSTVCPDCAEVADDEEEKENPDFDDVKDLEEVLEEDEDEDEDEEEEEEEEKEKGEVSGEYGEGEEERRF